MSYKRHENDDINPLDLKYNTKEECEESIEFLRRNFKNINKLKNLLRDKIDFLSTKKTEIDIKLEKEKNKLPLRIKEKAPASNTIKDCEKFIFYLNKIDIDCNKLKKILNKKIIFLKNEKLNDDIDKYIKRLPTKINLDIENRFLKYNTKKECKKIIKLLDPWYNYGIYIEAHWLENISLLKKLLDDKIKFINQQNTEIKQEIDKLSNQIKIDALKTIWKFIKENKWISTILFFGFGLLVFLFSTFLKIGYIPFLLQSELFSVMISLSAFIIITAILFLFLMLGFVFLYYDDKHLYSTEPQKSQFLYISFIPFMLYILLSYSLSYDIYGTKIDFIETMLSWVINNQRTSMIICMIISFVSMFLFVKFHIAKWIIGSIAALPLIIIFIINGDIIYILFILLIAMLILLFKQGNEISIIILYFIFSLFFLITTSILIYEPLFKIMNYGFINYKYLMIDKKAKYVLPRYVCDKNSSSKIISYNLKGNRNITYDDNCSIENIYLDKVKFTKTDNSELRLDLKNLKNLTYEYNNLNLTYKTKDKNSTSYEKNIIMECETCRTTYTTPKDNNETIRLHNIKALSTLGKFYYLETKCGKKFELLSKYVLGSEK